MKGRGSICKIAEINMAPTRLRQKNMGGSGRNGSGQSCAQLESGVFLVQMSKKSHGGNNVIPNVHFQKVNGMQKGGKNRDSPNRG